MGRGYQQVTKTESGEFICDLNEGVSVAVAQASGTLVLSIAKAVINHRFRAFRQIKEYSLR